MACTNVNTLEQTPPEIPVAQSEPSKPVPLLETQKTESATTSNELAWAQLNLDALGYKLDNTEGKLTQATRVALADFQRKSGLPVTGTLNPATFEALEQMVQNKRLSPQPGDTISQRPSSATDKRKPEKPSAATSKDKPTTPSPIKSFTDIQTVGIYKVAAYLAEIDYFRIPLKLATLETVKTALKLFQQKIGVTATGFLDDVTLKKLRSIKLSHARKAELEAITVESHQGNTVAAAPDPSRIQKPVPLITQPQINSNGQVVSHQPVPVVKPSPQQTQATASAGQKNKKPGEQVKPTTSSAAISVGGKQGSTIVITPDPSPIQKPISPITQPKVNSDGQVMANKQAAVVKQSPQQTQVAASAATAQKTDKPSVPVVPTTTSSSIFKPGESVYVLDRLECKGDHEAFALFYQGRLEQIRPDKVKVRISKRYAMWYDAHKKGVSDTDWWCIPKKRFCYSSINFTDWRGKLKPGSVGEFKTKWTIPSHADMTALVAKSSKSMCSF